MLKVETSLPSSKIEPDVVGKRPCNKGQLPPGCSTVTFTVDSLNDLNLDFVGDIIEINSIVYNGRRSRTAKGYTGELIELIEE